MPPIKGTLPGRRYTCKVCDGQFVFARTQRSESGAGGKAMPLDLVPNPDGNVAVRAIAKDERDRSFTVETGGAKARERAKGLRRAANLIDATPDGGFAIQLAQRGIDEMASRVASNSDVRKRVEEAKLVADAWNLAHPVGTRVLAKLLVSEVIGATTTPAYTRHTAVLVDVGAYEGIALERVTLMPGADQ